MADRWEYSSPVLRTSHWWKLDDVRPVLESNFQAFVSEHPDIRLDDPQYFGWEDIDRDGKTAHLWAWHCWGTRAG